MAKTAGRILKADNVKLEGQVHLNAVQASAGDTQKLLKGQNVASATPQVRIVENHSEFAVMEITCSCGTKTYLRCEYADSESSAEPPEKVGQTK